MIDCKRCRDLVDADVAGTLEAKDRTPMAVHLRGCHDCVAYKTKRLQDSSILRRPVAELKEQPAPEAPPPPPPARPSPLPWILTAALLIVATAGGILLLRDDASDVDDDPVRREARSAAPAPVEDERPTPTPDPAPRTAERESAGPAIPTVQVFDGARPVAGAWVSIAANDAAGSESRRIRADAQGRIELAGPLVFPIYLTAHAGDSLSATHRCVAPEVIRLALTPAAVITATLQTESDQPCAVVASWAGGGRAIVSPDENGRLRIPVPTPRAAVELRAWTEAAPRFALTSGRLAVGHPLTGPVDLTAQRAHRLDVQPTPTSPVERAFAIAADGRAFALSPVAGTETLRALVPPGAYRIELDRPGFRRFESMVNVAADTVVDAPGESSSLRLSGQIVTAPPSDVLAAVVIRPAGAATSPSPRAPWPTGWETERWWPPWQVGVAVEVAPGGRFEATGLPWSQVVVDAGDDGRTTFGPFSLPADNLRLDLHANATVAGTVRDGAGQLMGGLEVNLETAGQTRRILTNRDGYYAFENVAIGRARVFPRASVANFANGRESKQSYEVLTTPAGTTRRDFTLVGAAPTTAVIKDVEGRDVRSALIVAAADGQVVATANPGADPAQGLVLPPLVPGEYLLHLIENEVIFPLGPVTLPGPIRRSLRRDGPQIEVTGRWAAGPTSPRAAKLTIAANGATVAHLVVPLPGVYRIGGLNAGRYRITLTYGARRAVGMVDTPADPRPETARLTLSLE